MAKPTVTEVHLLSEGYSEQGNLTRKYKIEGSNLNVINVIDASDRTGNLRLPKFGEADPYSKATEKLYVTDIQVNHTGKYDASGTRPGVIDATVTYAPIGKFSAKRRKKKRDGGVEFPWDERAKISKTGDVIEVDMWGRDERNQPLVYSGGEPVNLQRPYPISNFSVNYKKKINDDVNWWGSADTFMQNVNDDVVTLKIAQNEYTYAARTLLVGGFGVSVEFFEYVDPITGQEKTIPYFDVNMNFIYRKDTWVTKIPDEGTKVINDAGEVVKPTSDVDKTRDKIVYLNGAGKKLLDNSTTDGLVDVKNAYGGGTSTDLGVTIAKTATEAIGAGNSDGAVRMVLLAFLIYNETDFSPLGLDTLIEELV